MNTSLKDNLFMYAEYIYSMLCLFLPNILWQIANRKHAPKKYRVRHLLWTYIFMFYLWMAVWEAAGIGTIYDLIMNGGPDNNINLIPFQSEGVMTYLLNVLMFMPLGFLLPLIWKEYRKLGKTILVGLGLSFTIEFFQLFCYRATDIDDLLMNALGTLTGYMIWFFFHAIFPKAGEKSITIRKGEPLVYIWLGILGIVLLFNWRWVYLLFY